MLFDCQLAVSAIRGVGGFCASLPWRKLGGHYVSSVEKVVTDRRKPLALKAVHQADGQIITLNPYDTTLAGNIIPFWAPMTIPNGDYIFGLSRTFFCFVALVLARDVVSVHSVGCVANAAISVFPFWSTLRWDALFADY